MEDLKIGDLTVTQLEKLIKKTVQEAMAEVLMEFTIAAEIDADVTYRAEMTNYLRSFLQDRPVEADPFVELDD